MCSDEISEAAHLKKKKRNFRRFLSAKLKTVNIKYNLIKEDLYIIKEEKGTGCIKNIAN